MNKSTNRHPSHRAILSVISIALLLASAGISQAQQIASRPLTPQEIHNYGLDPHMQRSGGLLVVGIGEAVYLEAQVEKGAVVSGATWSIESRPIGGSTAQLQDSPLPLDMPIYSPGDREILDVADRKMFVPDLVGKYTVKAVVNTDGGTIEMEALVVGAEYVGVGTMGEPAPAYPQCALCHEERAVEYMETGHASMFTEAIDGLKSSHYNESCIECHVLGLNPEAENGSFFAVADNLGWTFPETLEPGNWDALPQALKSKANIQCEHCHGPGSIHHGDITATAVSLSSGDCGQCHDEEPYHNINQQWNISRHSVATRYPTGPGRGSCVECHSGIGFIEEMDGVAEKSTDYEAIVCAACHDPHSVANEHQLRTLEDVTLNNGVVISEGGNGKFCLNCHKSRRDADEYVQGNVSSHYGPHYGITGDLFHGTNAIEYDGKVVGSPSGHLYATTDSCVSCHMQGGGDNMAGGHTWKMAADNGTPDDHSDDIPLTTSCTECHGEWDTFDVPTVDYNLDGQIEGLQTEVEHLLHALALLLHPVGSPEVIRGDSTHEYSDAEKKALYNYMCVEEDGSHGVHNPKYITAILKASIEDMADPFNATFQGINIPVGGEWFYSPWFEFYAPEADGWIYHFEHGHLAIAGDENNVYFYEDNTGKWRYTNSSIYPLIYDFDSGSWLYYYGRFKEMRYFYSYSSNDWIVVE